VNTGNKTSEIVQECLNALKKYGLSSEKESLTITCAKLYGWLASHNHVGIYRDDDFEKEFIKRYEGKFQIRKAFPNNKVLHVISCPSRTGGHSRLMERLASFSPGLCDVLVTRPFDLDGLALRLSQEKHKIYSSPNGYKIQDIYNILINYKSIVLHIHPDDIETSVAVGLVKNDYSVNVVFVNHADHCFSFGFYSSDIVAEVSSFGIELSKKRGVLSSFMGIPLSIEAFSECIRTASGNLRIFSAASECKFIPTKDFSMPRLTKKILCAIPQAKVTIIGPSLLNHWWWATKLRFPYRLILCSSLPYDEYISLMQESDIYLDSIPMGGGTALPEMRKLGVPVSGIKTDGMGYTAFDLIKCESEDELVIKLKSLAQDEDNEIYRLNNDQVILNAARDFHADSAVRERFEGILSNCATFSSPVPNAANDTFFYEKMWIEKNIFNCSSDFLMFLRDVKSTEFRKFRKRVFLKLPIKSMIKNLWLLT
jgi:hypothetical protein